MKQQNMLLQHFGCTRFIYNWGLDLKIKAYLKDKTQLSYIDLAKELTLLKKTEEYNHNLAKSISSASWSEFRRMLTYKCEWYGKNLLIIDRFEPSSKTCNNCGYVYKGLTLSERSWKYPVCLETLDRDINAAKNIRDMALRKVV